MLTFKKIKCATMNSVVLCIDSDAYSESAFSQINKSKVNLGNSFSR